MCAGPDLPVSCCLAGLLLTCSPLARRSEQKTRRVAGTWQSSIWWRLSCPSLKAFRTSCRWALQMLMQEWYQNSYLLPELCSLPSAELLSPCVSHVEVAQVFPKEEGFLSRDEAIEGIWKGRYRCTQPSSEWEAPELLYCQGM